MGVVAFALCGPWGMVGCSWLYSADALTSAQRDDSGSGPDDAHRANDASDATSGEAGPSDASVEDGPTCAIKSGYFGLTAGTGIQTDAVALRNFKGAFYPCVL
jgi:hypothetical protein